MAEWAMHYRPIGPMKRGHVVLRFCRLSWSARTVQQGSLWDRTKRSGGGGRDGRQADRGKGKWSETYGREAFCGCCGSISRRRKKKRRTSGESRRKAQDLPRLLRLLAVVPPAPDLSWKGDTFDGRTGPGLASPSEPVSLRRSACRWAGWCIRAARRVLPSSSSSSSRQVRSGKCNLSSEESNPILVIVLRGSRCCWFSCRFLSGNCMQPTI